MSKLGKIFIVRYRTGEYSKEVYPIVYENQERYVCKVPGCYEIREFVKDNSRYGVITVEEFYREVQMGLNPSHAYKVFVSNQDKIDFERQHNNYRMHNRYNTVYNSQNKRQYVKRDENFLGQRNSRQHIKVY